MQNEGKCEQNNRVLFHICVKILMEYWTQTTRKFHDKTRAYSNFRIRVSVVEGERKMSRVRVKCRGSKITKKYLFKPDNVTALDKEIVNLRNLLGNIVILLYVNSFQPTIQTYTAISIKVVLRAKRKSRIRARKAAGNR